MHSGRHGRRFKRALPERSEGLMTEQMEQSKHLVNRVPPRLQSSKKEPENSTFGGYMALLA
jgi:hypothetical protein